MIQDEDLVMSTKFKHPGQVKTGTAVITITARSMSNNTAYTYTTDIPIEDTGFNTVQLYTRDPSDSTKWFRTPDTIESGSPDFLPVNIAGVIDGSTLKLSATYRNTFGGTANVTARTFTVKYFLFV